MSVCVCVMRANLTCAYDVRVNAVVYAEKSFLRLRCDKAALCDAQAEK